VVFGLTPALRATRTNPGETMKAGARGSSDAREGVTLRRALVIVQVALSLVLVVGAVLLGRTLRNLMTMDPGFRTTGIVVASVDMRQAHVPVERRAALVEQMVDQVRALPGVRSAAEAAFTPMSGSSWNDSIIVDAKVLGISNFNSVGPAYFRTLGTPFVDGRDFDAHDSVSSAQVAIVNDAFARKFLAGRRAVGQVFQIEGPSNVPRVNYQVIGVVKNTKYNDFREPLGPIAFLSLVQDPDRDARADIVLSSDAPIAGLSNGVTSALTAVERNIVVQYHTMDAQIRDSLVSERMMATLSGFFGGLAALIAAIGLYGVMSYIVARRKIEIGIRMALGADQRSVLRLVMREAAALLAAGVVLGAILSAFAARATSTLLYGLEPWDPATYALGLFVMALVSLVATWLPARRAAHLPPTIALREE
jgi:predicted permease